MGKYVYEGNKGADDGTSRIILEGTFEDPTSFVDLGGEVELTDEQFEQLSEHYVLTAGGAEEKTANVKAPAGKEAAAETT